MVEKGWLDPDARNPSGPPLPEADRRLALDAAMMLLRAGNYANGWPLYEARNLAKPTDIGIPEWRGEPLADRRLLIWPEQGLGDKIMLARFFPQLQRAGARLTVLCEPALARLFEINFDAEIVLASGSVELPNADYWIMYGSLPLRLGVTLDDLPQAPYLAAPPRKAASERIGIVTRGNPALPNDANRSLPPDLAQELLSLPGALSLHYEDLGVRDLWDTAQIVAGLDLVISVDTSIAHLAGAMGKPVWVLLPAIGTDWRWMQGRADSPWYPSARLFRQGADGDWRPVLEAVRRELTAAP